MNFHSKLEEKQKKNLIMANPEIEKLKYEALIAKYKVQEGFYSNMNSDAKMYIKTLPGLYVMFAIIAASVCLSIAGYYGFKQYCISQQEVTKIQKWSNYPKPEQAAPVPAK